MEAQTVKLSDLHYEHQLWDNEMRFFRDEIKIMEKRLGELITHYTDKGVLSGMEHYQNQFIRQREMTDKLLHEIKAQEVTLLSAMKNATAGDIDMPFEDNPDLRDKVEQHRHIYNEMKADFYRFIDPLM